MGRDRQSGGDAREGRVLDDTSGEALFEQPDHCGDARGAAGARHEIDLVGTQAAPLDGLVDASADPGEQCRCV